MRKRKSTLIVKILLSLLGVFVVLGIVAFIAFYLPYTKIKAKAQVVATEGNLLKEDFKKNDIDLVKKRMVTISEKYADLEKESKLIYWATSIPYIHDYKSGIEAGRYMLEAGRETIEAIYPYADLIGLKKGELNFHDKSADDRLQTAVLTLDKMLSRLDVVSKNIDEAEKRISTIDPNRYPEKFGGREVRSNIVIAKDQFQGIATLFVDAKPFLKQIPAILGANGEKNYLMIFQNIAEQRATGGFMTFWSVLNINKGKITVKASSDIYDLDKEIGTHPAAPEKIKTLLKQNQLYIRDTNYSPDVPTSIAQFDALYQKAGNKVKYDGIVLLDSKILVDMLQIFGDTQVNGINFSATIDKRCDCPQVIYALFATVDKQVGHVVYDRKRILGDLMIELFHKAIGFSPKLYWGRLMEMMFRNLDEKHILLNYNDKAVQQAVEKLNYAGKIRDYDGDYLHINNVNFGGAKSNLYIKEEMTSETTTANGQIKRTVKVVFRNPHAASNCNEHQVEILCLNAPLADWMRVYVPKGAKLESFTGTSQKATTYEELGKTVFESIVQINPLGKAEVNITYTLPSTVDASKYKLLIQKQAGELDQKWTVTVDGQKKYTGALETDKEIK